MCSFSSAGAKPVLDAAGLVSHLTKGYVSYEFPFGSSLAAFQLELRHDREPDVLASSRNCRSASRRRGVRIRRITTRVDRTQHRRELNNPPGARLTFGCSTPHPGGPRCRRVVRRQVQLAKNQGAIREQDLVAGQGGNAFGSEIQWLTPRRAFFGVRVRF